MATQLKLTQQDDGKILIELTGDNADIGVILCQAMIEDVDVASIVCGAIPTFLDKKKLDRAGFCEQIMKAHGYKDKM